MIIINSYLFAAAADVTPDAVSNRLVAYAYVFDEITNDYFQITGINQSIQLQFSSFSSVDLRVFYQILNTQPEAGDITSDPTLGSPWIEIFNDGTISISNNQYLLIGGAHLSGPGNGGLFAVTIINNSDSNAQICIVNFEIIN
jgi:hypothetical protein